MTKEEKDNLLNPEDQKYYNMKADWHGKILEFKKSINLEFYSKRVKFEVASCKFSSQLKF